ncbi:Lipoprotein releasing system ATP-binding protein LolD [Hyphomicrobium sulfonivorans]|uniref:Lipoprotein releasing system ATP-binding protein LolD n=1 Tax=Hyphomicrobium sulfonivorans TaxID=121290 RepID=A0A120CWZ9_HYPSL|nr:ABC transporter ATP-binding protein [Hyphomicrobium sulfonivorans]KWT70182.1 Lipoprotein releasing system ATP-binding protein LolD [Hyphomicrobium sulfonivorans]
MTDPRVSAIAEELLTARKHAREAVTHPHQQPALRLDGLVRAFHQGTRRIDVLKGASVDILPGQAVALVGPSGAGKSTLLHIAGLLETPDSGHVIVNGRDCSGMGDADRTRVRRVEMGFVYQFHQLLPEFSALENVMIPQLIRGRSKSQAAERARELLGTLGLAERLEHRPAQLSGGEQQRTAIARALANSPRLILADEPTGNLDPYTAEHVFEALLHLIHTTGVAALIATHNMDLARRMDRVLRLEGGALVEVQPLGLT